MKGRVSKRQDDGKILLTHVVAALSISDQLKADKLLGDSLSCHVCTVPDDWVAKAATCRLYELAPKHRNFVRPITAILGRLPWSVRLDGAGNTGTVQFRMRGHKRAYYTGGKCDSLADKADCKGCGMSTPGL